MFCYAGPLTSLIETLFLTFECGAMWVKKSPSSVFALLKILVRDLAKRRFLASWICNGPMGIKNATIRSSIASPEIIGCKYFLCLLAIADWSGLVTLTSMWSKTQICCTFGEIKYFRYSWPYCYFRMSFFLPRDALVHSAVLRLHVVRLSVRLSVTLVDQDRIGWKSWKLIARSIKQKPSLFVAQRLST